MPNEEEAERIYTLSLNEEALRRGEILSDISQTILKPDCIEDYIAHGGVPVVDEVKHAWAIVLTQDCDLDWDFKARNQQDSQNKRIPNILFCEVVTAEDLKGSSVGNDIWKRIRQNQDERYHFLQKIEPGDDSQNFGIPELGIDFKRYFTLPTEEVYKRLEYGAKRRSLLNGSYLQHIITRFFHFQLRVALPAEHRSE